MDRVLQATDETEPAWDFRELSEKFRGSLIGEFVDYFDGKETETERKALYYGVEAHAEGEEGYMKIRELNIKGFGKFQGTRILLEDGINLISGENESGKSTLHAFVRGMLFGQRRQRGRASRMTATAAMSPGRIPGFTAAPCGLKAEARNSASPGISAGDRGRNSWSVRAMENAFLWRMEIWICCWAESVKRFLTIPYPWSR